MFPLLGLPGNALDNVKIGQCIFTGAVLQQTGKFYNERRSVL